MIIQLSFISHTFAKKYNNVQKCTTLFHSIFIFKYIDHKNMFLIGNDIFTVFYELKNFCLDR